MTEEIAQGGAIRLVEDQFIGFVVDDVDGDNARFHCILMWVRERLSD